MLLFSRVILRYCYGFCDRKSSPNQMSEPHKNTIPRIFYYFARLVLIGMFLAVTVLQLLSFPGQFRFEASNGQGSQLARWVLTFMVGIWFLVGQVAIVALWKILTLIYQNRLLTSGGRTWVNLLSRTLATSALYGAAVTITAALKADDPGPVVIVATLTTSIFTMYIVSYFIRHQIFRQPNDSEIVIN